MDLTALKRNSIDEDRHPAYIMDFEGDIWVAIPKDYFDLLEETLCH